MVNGKAIVVLIDTQWNVNAKDNSTPLVLNLVLIDTQWNVNETTSLYMRFSGMVLIDTQWNVNEDILTREEFGHWF